MALKDREAASQLVTQLQSDLARAGDHLAWFSSEKRDLGKALLLAQERMDRVERASRGRRRDGPGWAAILRSCSAKTRAWQSSRSAHKKGRVVLESPEGDCSRRAPTRSSVDAGPVLAALARAANDHQSLKLTIAAPGAGELETRRAARLMTALADRGLPRERRRARWIENRGARERGSREPPAGASALRVPFQPLSVGRRRTSISIAVLGIAPARRGDGFRLRISREDLEHRVQQAG